MERSEREGERREGEDGSPARPADAERLVDRQDSPEKRHGDALRDGSGSRHGEPPREADAGGTE